MRAKLIALGYVFILLFSIVFEWLKYDIAIIAKGRLSLGAEIIFGHIIYMVYIFYGLIVIFAAILPVIKMKTLKLWHFAPITMTIIALIFHFVFLPSQLYTSANYSVLSAQRQETVSMLLDGEIIPYHGDASRYIATYRLTSQKAKIYVDDSGGVKKIIFYTHCGIYSDNVIVYVPDGSELKEKWNFTDIKMFDDNWYSAKIIG